MTLILLYKIRGKFILNSGRLLKWWYYCTISTEILLNSYLMWETYDSVHDLK